MWALPDVPAEQPVQHTSPAGSTTENSGRPLRPGSIRTPLPLQPSGIAEVCDGGFEALKLRPQAFIGIAAIFTLPVQAVLLVLSRASGSGTFATASFSSLEFDEIGPGELLVLYAGGGMALAWSTAAAALLLSSWYAGHDRTTGEVVIASLKKTHHLLLAWVLAHIFQFAFIFGGGVTVVVGAAFTVAVTPAIIVENTGALGGLRRSMRLTRSDFGRSIGYVIVTGMLVLIILPALGLIPWFIVSQYDFGGEWLLVSAVAAAGVVLVNAFLSAATTLFYLDLRVRSEGVDLVLQLPDRFDRRSRPR